ncbi:hypothetical protein [Burkholderia sp. LMG 32019]|uniref:hypothetical protein n=1 Tax=Burkholderia sp. LMG 32019 TaxID=3158173 RepID=UPI003C3037C8
MKHAVADRPFQENGTVAARRTSRHQVISARQRAARGVRLNGTLSVGWLRARGVAHLMRIGRTRFHHRKMSDQG